MHQRLRPFRHKFRYWVYQLLLDIDQLDQDCGKAWCLSYNRFNWLSFYDRDHGHKDGSSLRAWADEQLGKAGLEQGQPVYLLSFPRVFGYVFNPISLWYSYGSDGQLQALIYEVSNTIGETHSYIVPTPDGQALASHQATKKLHVSPFFDRQGGYAFRTSAPEETLSFMIRYGSEGAEKMIASLRAEQQPLKAANLIAASVKQPFMTLKVFAGILWEAAILKLKGARYHDFPEPLATKSSVSEPEPLEQLDLWREDSYLANKTQAGT